MLTGSLLLSSLVLAIGLAMLIVGSDQLVDGAASISRRLGLSATVVGVVVIGFGTSTPELLVTLLAGLEGVFDLGVGNIVGSNIANVLLVLGVAAIVGPVAVRPTTVRREVPLSLLGVAAFAWAIQGPMRRMDAVLLALLLAAVVGVMLLLAQRDPGPAQPAVDVSLRRESLRALLGLVGTLAGAQAVVLGGGGLATAAGLSDALVGLTLVAVGTSLPELATAVQAVRRGESELLVGNILGSNLFNAAAVGPVVIWAGAGLGRSVSPSLAGTATLAMVVSAVAVSLVLGLRRRIARTGGIVLLVGYVLAVAVISR